MRQQLRQSEENSAQLKIRLNEERARHAETADQSRALTHLAAQLRTKTEKYESLINKQDSNAKKLQTVIFLHFLLSKFKNKCRRYRIRKKN